MLIIRVHAKTRASEHRSLNVSEDGNDIACDCGGFPQARFCSHIDAVLVAGEREMVVEADREIADRAMLASQNRIAIPADWKAAWRGDLRWRGLSRVGARRQLQRSGKPLVCFTGGKNRPDWIAKAQAEGWDTIDSPSPFTDVLVAADVLGSSRKLAKARQNGTAIVTYDQWGDLMTDGVLP